MLSLSFCLCHPLMADVSVSQGLSKSKCDVCVHVHAFPPVCVFVCVLYLVEPALC